MSTMQRPPGTHTRIDGREYLYFAGTGYLGLQGRTELIVAAQAALAEYGIHTATTRTGYGNCPPVLDVEARASRFMGGEQACYLVSGYAGNFAIAAALDGEVDLVLIDESAHDCLREAARSLTSLARPPIAFRHCDAGHLAELLAANASRGVRPLVMTDGVFAASGRLAPLGEYLAVLSRYDAARLLVDDAHGLATIGATGKGSLELAGVDAADVNTGKPLRDLTSNSNARVYCSSTLSKAIGGHGGVVAGGAGFMERFRGASGWYRGSSAPAAAIAAATAKGLEIVATEPALRARLAANVTLLRGKLAAQGLDVPRDPSPILGIRWRSALDMQRVQQQLLADGIAIAYTRDYAGAGPEGLLRIAVFATHTEAMIEQLVEAVSRAL